MAKKTLMTGVGVQITAISTDDTFPLGNSYCVDVNKECADNTLSDKTVFKEGYTGSKNIKYGAVTKKFLCSPTWMNKFNSEECLYSSISEGFFPATSNSANRTGWDRFGKPMSLTYVDNDQPPLAITTTQEDLFPGYRNQRYNFLFQCNQQNYHLEWSLIEPPEGAILESCGYFYLDEGQDKKETYLLKVQVFNPDTDEKATKEFTLVTAHPSYVPDADNNGLRILGPDVVNIQPHWSFKAVWEAAGGLPPYTMWIDGPLASQWPFRESYENTIDTYPSSNQSLRIDYTTSEIVLAQGPSGNSPASYPAGSPIIFDKGPDFVDNGNTQMPGGIQEDKIYYCAPQFDEDGNYTSRIKIAETKQAALNNGPFVTIFAQGTYTESNQLFIRYKLPGVIAQSKLRQSSLGYMTVNKYVKSIALNLAIAPLPVHWGHANHWEVQTLAQNPTPLSISGTSSTYNGYSTYGTSLGSLVGFTIYSGGFLGFPTNPVNGQVEKSHGMYFSFNASKNQWEYVSGREVLVTDDPEKIITYSKSMTYKPGYSGYESRGLGQNLEALGFGKTLMNYVGGNYISTTSPGSNFDYSENRFIRTFDPWRYKSLEEKASNYFDVCVKDFNGNVVSKRVYVQEPEDDYNPQCGVPYWHAKINFYSVYKQPYRTRPRTSGTAYTMGANGSIVTASYNPSLSSTEFPNSYFSSTETVLDNVDYFCYPMDVYYPASRFVDFPATTVYENNKTEVTFFPYEKLILPLNTIPYHMMSIHPIQSTDIPRSTSASNANAYFPFYTFNYYGGLSLPLLNIKLRKR